MSSSGRRRSGTVVSANSMGGGSSKWHSSGVHSAGHSSHSANSLNGVNNLRPKCEQTMRLIAANPNGDSVINHEKQLWNDVKEYRHENDITLIDYLIGFYVSLLESVLMHSSRKEPYMKFPNCSQLSPNARFLVYNVLIRIGDLNRYLNKTSVAEIYYTNAKKLDPLRGHAYNQLAIATPLASQPFKCIYYSARAAKASVEPTIVAETNLKMAINRFSSGVLRSVFHLPSSSENDNFSEREDNKDYPQTGIDWFYLSVIAIYSDNLKPIFKPLLEFLLYSCETFDNKFTENNDFSFALMAFDVLIDWIALRDLKKHFSDEYAKELKDLRSKIKNFAEFSDDSIGLESSQNKNSQNSDSISTNALFHDYLLRGFSPLKEIHQNLNFDSNEVLAIDFSRLSLRVVDKLEKLFSKLAKPRKMRNVALESILEREQTPDL